MTMKKAGLLHGTIRLFCAAACFFLFTACGLETFYFLDPPVSTGHNVDYNSSDPMSRYFSFRTTETGNNSELPSDFSFQGTEVYYKIFNNYNTMKNYEATIDNLNTSTSSSAADAANKLKSYGYQTLKLDQGSAEPLIRQDGRDRYVYIRLTDLDDASVYQNIIFISASAMSSYITETEPDPNDPSQPSQESTIIRVVGKPRRSINSSYGFNFDRKDPDNNPLPVKDDADTVLSDEGTEEGMWYVDMYAVSQGMDTTFTTSYSRVLFLGSLSIEEKKED